MRVWLCILLVFSAMVNPLAAMTMVARTVPETVSAEAVAKVEQAAVELRALLASCEERSLSLPDEPGKECSDLLAALDEGWSSYVRTMHRWGYIDDSRDWMKPLWWPKVELYGSSYAFEGLPLPEERAFPKPLLAAVISLMRAELEGSQREHLDCVRRLQEAQEPAPWEVEDAPSLYELPLLLP